MNFHKLEIVKLIAIAILAFVLIFGAIAFDIAFEVAYGPFRDDVVNEPISSRPIVKRVSERLVAARERF